MTKFKRRDFIKAGSVAALGSIALPSFAYRKEEINLEKYKEIVNFTRDGLDLSPQATASLLHQLTEQNSFKADVYSLGKIVSDFEEKFAKSLGKEAAIYMPTGTLANHIALRTLSQGKGKIIVQEQSHIYQDSGDMAQRLSGLNLMPLAHEKTYFTLEELQQKIQAINTQKIEQNVSVISMESSVRRKQESVFDFEEMKKISMYAKGNNIKLHMDGARLFTSSVYTGVSPKEYAQLFDTVYVSLYKYFNTISGAMLVGSKTVIKDLYHERRMFGGGLRSVWENIIIADYYFDNFQDRFKDIVIKGESIFEQLNNSEKFTVSEIEDGSTVYKMKIPNVDLNIFREQIINKGISFPKPTTDENCFYIKINESLKYMKSNEIVKIFLACV